MVKPHTQTATIKDRFPYLVDLRLPGFEKSVPPGEILQYSLVDRASSEWFEMFVSRISDAIGHHFLPVFRVSDGEFLFSVGYRIPYPPPGKSPIAHYLKQIGSYVLKGKNRTFMSGSRGYGYEAYTKGEWSQSRPHYIQCLRQIAEEGILAVVLYTSPDHFAEQYYLPMLKWFDQHDMQLADDNYFPFYFVYALLNGPKRFRLYSGRRILVVTSMDDAKEQAIDRGLRSVGAADVQYIRISRNKALLDRISLGDIALPIDIVLIGAGVGAANILVQLRELNTLCIDAGYCLDLLATPELSGKRYFTQPD